MCDDVATPRRPIQEIIKHLAKMVPDISTLQGIHSTKVTNYVNYQLHMYQATVLFMYGKPK